MANPEDLGRYRLKRLLGRGALGEVWEASDLEEHGAKVAVKIMHAAEDELAFARSQFGREARLASLLRHPNVVSVRDAGEAAGTSFMVMEMVEGKSLRTLMRADEGSIADKLRWLRQIGDGLSALHRGGIVHRDLKPENVIVRHDRTACLVDLGIAKWTKFDLGGVRDPMDVLETLDTPGPNMDYVPLETIEDEIFDELGDQYAWGVLAYELITGALPVPSSVPLTERDDVPHAVAVAIDRARARRRSERWDGMELLLDELVDHAASKRPPALSDAAPTSTAVVPSAESPVEADGSASTAVHDEAPAVSAQAASVALAAAGPRLPAVFWVGAVLLVLLLAVMAALR